MEQIIDISDELFSIFKKHGIMAFDYLNEYDKDNLARIIANGTPYNPTGNCISREALKKEIQHLRNANPSYLHKCDVVDRQDVLDEIDNAQAIPLPNEQTAWEQGYEAGLAQGKHDKGTGEWTTDERGYFYCDKCKQHPYNQYAMTNFCPNCGADMREGGERQ